MKSAGSLGQNLLRHNTKWSRPSPSLPSFHDMLCSRWTRHKAQGLARRYALCMWGMYDAVRQLLRLWTDREPACAALFEMIGRAAVAQFMELRLSG